MVDQHSKLNGEDFIQNCIIEEVVNSTSCSCIIYFLGSASSASYLFMMGVRVIIALMAVLLLTITVIIHRACASVKKHAAEPFELEGTTTEVGKMDESLDLSRFGSRLDMFNGKVTASLPPQTSSSVFRRRSRRSFSQSSQ